MFSELKDFDYEPPTMSYDKKTGEINIVENLTKAQEAASGSRGKKSTKRLISSVDDLDKEKQALFAEVGLDNDGRPKNQDESIDKVADKIKLV
jgi:hypothetical protein